MKTRTRNRVAAVLLTFGISLPAQASPPCLAPEPTCAVVLLSAVVIPILHGSEKSETDDPQADRKRIPHKVRANGVAHTDHPPRFITAREPTDRRCVLRNVCR